MSKKYKTREDIDKIKERLGCPICEMIGEKKKQCYSHAITRFYQDIISENGMVYHLDKRHKNYLEKKKKRKLVGQEIESSTAHKLFCSEHDSNLFGVIEKKTKKKNINSNDKGAIAYQLNNKKNNQNEIKHLTYAFRAFSFTFFEEIHLIVYDLEKHYKIRIEKYNDILSGKINQNKLGKKMQISILNIRNIWINYYKKFIDIFKKYNFNSIELSKNYIKIYSEIESLKLKTKVFKIEKKLDFLTCTKIDVRYWANYGVHYYINIIPKEDESYILISYFSECLKTNNKISNMMIKTISPNINKFIYNLEKKYNNRKEFELFISRELIIKGDYLVFNERLKKRIETDLNKDFFKAKEIFTNDESVKSIIKEWHKVRRFEKSFRFNLFS